MTGRYDPTTLKRIRRARTISWEDEKKMSKKEDLVDG